jgi:hypothetical protein
MAVRQRQLLVASDTRTFARDIGLEPRTTPIESPQSNGWPKPSCARSSATMSASVRARMLQPSCVNCQPESPIQRGSPAHFRMALPLCRRLLEHPNTVARPAPPSMRARPIAAGERRSALDADPKPAAGAPACGRRAVVSRVYARPKMRIAVYCGVCLSSLQSFAMLGEARHQHHATQTGPSYICSDECSG